MFTEIDTTAILMGEQNCIVEFMRINYSEVSAVRIRQIKWHLQS